MFQLNQQEKYSEIPEDLGKDVNTVQSLTRKHEAFENDLVALENQVRDEIKNVCTCYTMHYCWNMK